MMSYMLNEYWINCYILNYCLFQVLFSFAQKGAVTSASFRTDAPAYSGASPYLVTSSASGSLYVWHLGSSGSGGEPAGPDSEDGARTRRLVHVLEDAHSEYTID